MPANVETMFYVREKPGHGLGTEVQETPTSADALICAGLDWEVIQKNVYTEDAFQFTDDLLGAGVTYETAGALQGGQGLDAGSDAPPLHHCRERDRSLPGGDEFP